MKDWDDIVKAADRNTYLRQAVVAVDTGRANREEALSTVLLAMTDAYDTTKQEVIRIMNARPPSVFLKRD